MTVNLRDVFRQAARNLELVPLLTSEQIAAFRVDYGIDTLVRLEQVVDDAPAGGKVIFSGHRGCGKSTLLARFSREMQKTEDYFVVLFSISDMVEMSAVDHVNILYATAIQLLSHASQRSIQIPDKTKQEVLGWMTDSHSSTISKATSAELGLGGDLLQLASAKLKTESTFRDEIKRTYQKQISVLTKHIEVIAQCIATTTRKQVLVIIDDLDKLDWRLVEEIYKHNINALFQPEVKMVFTIPIAVIRDLEFRTNLRTASGQPIQQMEVAQLFGQAERHTPNAAPNADKLSTLVDVLKKRIPADYIEPHIFEQIALKSGGVIRELVRIAQACCTECSVLVRKQPDRTDIKINDQILELALINLRNEFEVSLGTGRKDILLHTYEQAQPPDVNDPEFLTLLHGVCLVEYRNGNVWYDVHPIVVDILKRDGLLS
jgi:energy-coupling factor transporter ATP-binding protein EcfA2